MVDPTIWLIAMFLLLSPIIGMAIWAGTYLKKWSKDVVLLGFFLFFTGTSIYCSYGIIERYVTRSPAVQYWGQTGDWKTPEAIAVGAKQILKEEGEIYWYPYFFSGMPSIILGWYGTEYRLYHKPEIIAWCILAAFYWPSWCYQKFGGKGLFLGAFIVLACLYQPHLLPFTILIVLDTVEVFDKEDAHGTS